MLEQWKSIPGYEGLYEVSNLGNVRSPRRILRQQPISKWAKYQKVSLFRDRTLKTFAVHRLVMITFVGPRPDGMETCHNNGDPTDNRLANLRYDTPSSNIADRIRHDKRVYVKKTHCIHGHLYTANARSEPSRKGKAVCRTCRRIQAQRRRENASTLGR